jgi:hypothetical protein
MRAARAAVSVARVRAPGGAPHGAPAVPFPVRQAGTHRRLCETGVGARLLERLDAATAHPSDHTMGALRAAVTDLADRMRARELPLERVVAAVEALLREHGTPRPGPTLHAGEPPTRAGDAPGMHARLVDWCIRAYRDDDWW